MPPAPKLPPPPVAAKSKVSFVEIPDATGHRVLLYGPGGIGKTTLATLAPGPVAFFDLDESLARLKPQLKSQPMTIDCDSWDGLRSSLQLDGWDEIKTIVIDSVTKAEELAVAHTLATVKHEKGHTVTRIDDYGYGKGYQFLFDTFLPILGDLDQHCRRGRNIILIAHDCVSTVPNPAGEDWMRYEPRLQCPASGKAAIRLRVREWCDHCLFIGYDVAVNKDGKGQGSGTRTLYPAEMPHCMAKSRSIQDQIPIEKDNGELWGKIFG